MDILPLGRKLITERVRRVKVNAVKWDWQNLQNRLLDTLEAKQRILKMVANKSIDLALQGSRANKDQMVKFS